MNVYFLSMNCSSVFCRLGGCVDHLLLGRFTLGTDQQCFCTQKTSTKGVARLRRQPQLSPVCVCVVWFVWIFFFFFCYSRRYLRVCDFRSPRWTLRAPTPSEPRPDLQTHRRSLESRSGSLLRMPGLRPCCGGSIRVCENKTKVAF